MPGGSQSPDALVQRGKQALEQGQLPEAIGCFRRALQLAPEHLQARLGLAQIAANTGNLDQARQLLEVAIAKHPTHPESRFRYALLLAASGELHAAVQALHEAHRLQPEQGMILIRKGLLELQLQRQEDAAASFQHALAVQPALSAASNDTRLPTGMREQVATAQKTLRQHYVGMLEDALQLARERDGKDATQRLAQCFAILRGQVSKQWLHPQQRPEFLLMPQMPARAWYEAEEFAWAERVRAQFAMIADEYQALLGHHEQFEPYIHGTGDGGDAVTPQGTDFSTLAGSRNWTAFHLDRAGALETNRKRCPRTSALMDELPLARADGYMPEVFFSLLEPGAHIVPHYGQMNVRLTVHLAVQIPSDCAIRVGEQTRQWMPGELLIFDDSFEHEAWNRSDELRGVLIFEVWHPALNDAEIFGLQQFFASRHAWMSRFAGENSGSATNAPINSS